MTEILFVLTAAFVAYVAHTVYNSSHDNANIQPSPPSPETTPDLSTVDTTLTTAIDQSVVAPPKTKTQAKKAVISPVIDQAFAIPAQVLPNSKPAKPDTDVQAKPPIPSTRPKAKAPIPTIAKASVRNPLSGEVSSISNNYRFIKRWVKDALVTEGLLTQVYKNNEITPENEALIKEAMAQLATMAKYKA